MLTMATHDGHLGCFQSGVVLNNGAATIFTYKSLGQKS